MTPPTSQAAGLCGRRWSGGGARRSPKEGVIAPADAARREAGLDPEAGVWRGIFLGGRRAKGVNAASTQRSGRRI
jgi:hypothetical protein